MVSYFYNSKSPLYSFLFTLPLFVIYEVGVFISSIDQALVIRNGADVLFRQLFSFLGLNGLKWLGSIFAVAYLSAFLIHKSKLFNTKLNLIYLPFMIFESVIWALFIYLFMIASSLFTVYGCIQMGTAFVCARTCTALPA